MDLSSILDAIAECCDVSRMYFAVLDYEFAQEYVRYSDPDASNMLLLQFQKSSSCPANQVDLDCKLWLVLQGKQSSETVQVTADLLLAAQQELKGKAQMAKDLEMVRQNVFRGSPLAKFHTSHNQLLVVHKAPFRRLCAVMQLAACQFVP